MTTTEQLTDILGNRLKKNEPMARHTNFRIGGPAKWFAEVRSVEELKQVLEIAKTENLETFVFGGGSNMLVNDNGFNGIAIKIAMRSTSIKETTVTAEAGVLSAGLARATANAGLKGLTWAISLPGTIGGGVRGNAGCFGGEIKDHLISAQVLRDGSIIDLTKEALEFDYRESTVKHNNDIVLSATFQLEEGDPEELKAELDQNIINRKTSQPTDGGSAGCLFKNVDVSEEDLQRLEQKLDIPAEMKSRRRLSVGWLIDNLDLKGTEVGDAKISEKHGNFMINKGNATADQVTQLIAIVKTKARDELGLKLEEEVQYIGF